MSWYDSITNIFSSETTPAPVEQSQEPVSSPTFSPQTMLSAHYSLANLCVTTQPLSQPNFPSKDSDLSNLQYLANVLEQLDVQIGPFKILSGYRTKELQNALSASGEPTASGTSFHELGRAVDIYPTTMSLADYFGRILADDNLKSQFAEIAIKPGQNSLHLSINTPDDVRTAKVLGLNDQGVYARLNVDEIAKYIEPFMQSAEAAVDYAAANLVTYNRTPLILAVAAACGGILFLTFKKGKAQ